VERAKLRLGLEKPLKVLPSWYSILLMAEQWGQLPWIIAGDNQEVLWFLRARVVNSIRADISNKKKKK
jgi:hypothetical protein